MECILILLIILTILIISSLFSYDHFKPINSLNIKYNSKNVRIPDQLKKPNKIELSLKDKINSELNNHPLTFKNQMYSMPVYPYVGAKKFCKKNSECPITAECNHDINFNHDFFNRDEGIGLCTVRTPDKSVFDISF